MRSFGVSTLMLVTVLACLSAADQSARLRVTQRDLVPLCLDGGAVPAGTRSWDVTPGPVSLVLSMRSPARSGQPTPDPGTASIAFTAEAGHRYEVEVRAEAMAFSARTWRAGEWTPVVRDRTVDRVVSGAPEWRQQPPCR